MNVFVGPRTFDDITEARSLQAGSVLIDNEV